MNVIYAIALNLHFMTELSASASLIPPSHQLTRGMATSPTLGRVARMDSLRCTTSSKQHAVVFSFTFKRINSLELSPPTHGASAVVSTA